MGMFAGKGVRDEPERITTEVYRGFGNDASRF